MLRKIVSFVLVITLLLTSFLATNIVVASSAFQTNAAFPATLPSGWQSTASGLLASGSALSYDATTTVTDTTISADITLQDNNPVQAGFYFRAGSGYSNAYNVFIHKNGSINRIELNKGDFANPISTYTEPAVNGTVPAIATANVTVNLKVTAIGGSIKVYLDDVLVIQTTDNTKSMGSIGLFRAGGSVAYSSLTVNDANVASIMVDGTAITGFDSRNYDYSYIVSGSQSQVPQVSATRTNSTDVITYTQAPQIPGKATVTVQNQDGLKSKYTVNFKREAKLTDITIDGQTLSGFSSAVYDYNYLVSSTSGDYLIPTVTATQGDSTCTVDYSYPEQLPGTIKITVSSKDGSASKVYSINCQTADSVNVINHIKTIKTQLSFDKTEAVIKDLTSKYPDQYSKKYINQLLNYELQIITIAKQNTNSASLPSSSYSHLTQPFADFSRESIIANPMVSSQRWVIETRNQYTKDHQNTHTSFPSSKWEYNDGTYTAGAAIKTVDFITGNTETLLSTTDGVAADVNVNWDGDKLLYSYRQDIDDSYHIYEMDLATKSSKQLTSMKFSDDMNPYYMPDGSIVFNSTREPKYAMCNTHIQANLYRMDGDGANIIQISKNTLYDRPSSVMPDGRIMYDRWEYTDRTFGDAQGVWTLNPDGTNQAHLYGNYLPSPGGIINAVMIPGTDKFVAIMADCHDRPWGPLAVFDPNKGDGEKDSVVQTWPSNAKDYVVNADGRSELWDDMGKYVAEKYEDPYPIDENYFVVSKKLSGSSKMAIYLVDTFGNETKLYEDSSVQGSFRPLPIKQTKKPNVIVSRRNFNYDFTNKIGVGKFYIQNVYEGTNMEGVAKGTAKTLRVVEAGEKHQYGKNGHWAGQGGQQPAMSWDDLLNKRIWSEVPIESDGSAYFEAPSDKFLLFQLLDANGKMIQTMRTSTVVQQGETTGCIGCHEDRRTAPSKTTTRGVPMALKRAASPINGWSADITAATSSREIRYFDYLKDVQPVFTAKCISCHDFGGTGSASVILAKDRDLVFNASYVDIWTKGLINVAGAGPSIHYDPYQKGSAASKLIKTIDAGHQNVALTPAEYKALVTWIDLNGVYYPEYAGPFRENMGGRDPISARSMLALNQLTGVSMGGGYDYTTNQVYHIGDQWNKRTSVGINVSFERPSLSPVLSRGNNLANHTGDAAKTTKYNQAIAIIQKGKQDLDARPEVNMTGYKVDGMDAFRQALYNYRLDTEYKYRLAMKNGTKLYDSQIPDFDFSQWSTIIGPESSLTTPPTAGIGLNGVEGDIPRLGASTPNTNNLSLTDPYNGQRNQPMTYISFDSLPRYNNYTSAFIH